MKKFAIIFILILIATVAYGQVDHYAGPEHIAYSGIEPLDSFGRLRVSPPFTIFDSQFNYDLQPSLFQQQVVNGSITHIPSVSTVRLSTDDVTPGSGAILQSKRYFRYLPGMSHQVVWTCVFGDSETGVVRTVGLLDDQDGLGFIQDETGIGVLRRTSTSGSPVDIVIPQSEWNLDKLDGSGEGKQVLDVNSDNIYIIDFQWLGAGRIRWGFDFSGHITYVHQVQWANTEQMPYMRTANLPFRVSIENVATADTTVSFDFTCVVINSEGGSEPTLITRSSNNAEASGGMTPLRGVNSGNEPLPIFSIRPRTTFKGLVNRGQVRPVSYHIASKNAPIAYSIVQGGILTGASFTAADSDSIVEADISATAITGGVIIGSGYLGAAIGMAAMGTAEFDLEDVILSNNIPGDTTEILSVVIRLADSVSSDCAGGFVWGELR